MASISSVGARSFSVRGDSGPFHNRTVSPVSRVAVRKVRPFSRVAVKKEIRGGIVVRSLMLPEKRVEPDKSPSVYTSGTDKRKTLLRSRPSRSSPEVLRADVQEVGYSSFEQTGCLHEALVLIGNAACPSLRFIFFNMEMMSAMLGVGLPSSVVHVDQNFEITVKEESEERWRQYWLQDDHAEPIGFSPVVFDLSGRCSTDFRHLLYAGLGKAKNARNPPTWMLAFGGDFFAGDLAECQVPDVSSNQSLIKRRLRIILNENVTTESAWSNGSNGYIAATKDNAEQCLIKPPRIAPVLDLTFMYETRVKSKLVKADVTVLFHAVDPMEESAFSYFYDDVVLTFGCEDSSSNLVAKSCHIKTENADVESQKGQDTKVEQKYGGIVTYGGAVGVSTGGNVENMSGSQRMKSERNARKSLYIRGTDYRVQSCHYGDKFGFSVHQNDLLSPQELVTWSDKELNSLRDRGIFDSLLLEAGALWTIEKNVCGTHTWSFDTKRKIHRFVRANVEANVKTESGGWRHRLRGVWNFVVGKLRGSVAGGGYGETAKQRYSKTLVIRYDNFLKMEALWAGAKESSTVPLDEDDGFSDAKLEVLEWSLKADPWGRCPVEDLIRGAKPGELN